MHRHKPEARAAIVAKATEILDNYGIADLTMRRLARELDVSPGALYWHFANKQELLGAVADEVLAPACAPVDSADWRRRITGVGTRLRDALLSHGDGAELVSASFAAGRSSAVRHLVDELSAAAADAGLAPGQADLAARTVVYYVLGFTADEQSRLQWDAAGVELAEGQSVLTNDDYARFAFGLQLLVDGVAARQTQAAQTQPV